MARVLIIGAGGVGSVVAHKCAQNPEVFTEIMLASRTVSKCDAIAASIKERTGRIIETARVNADDVPELVALIKRYKPVMVINVALPYQDLTIMDACLEAGVHYMDTANYEPLDVAKFEYKWQWAYQQKFKDAGLMALLGSGFDPGVTNVFAAYAQIHVLDIIDCNAGDHGQPFATNFNPEINIREVTAKGRYWERGEWVETDPLSWSMTYDFPDGIGPKKCFLMYHEELESLVQNLKGIRRARFWMTFSENYLNHLKVLGNVGMTGIEPVEFQGQQIVPIQFLGKLLPDPASLGPLTKGKTCIGCVMKGVKDGKEKSAYIYNIHTVYYLTKYCITHIKTRVTTVFLVKLYYIIRKCLSYSNLFSVFAVIYFIFCTINTVKHISHIFILYNIELTAISVWTGICHT